MQEKILRYVLKLINSGVLGKSMENLSKLTGIKLVATETRRNYLLSEAHYKAIIPQKFQIIYYQ